MQLRDMLIYVEGFTCQQCDRDVPCYQGVVQRDGKWWPAYFCELCNHHLDCGELLLGEDCGCAECVTCIALGCEDAWRRHDGTL